MGLVFMGMCNFVFIAGDVESEVQRDYVNLMLNKSVITSPPFFFPKAAVFNHYCVSESLRGLAKIHTDETYSQSL